MADQLLQIPCTTIDNRESSLGELDGKAYLVVNTGLRVVGFPCNQFGGQEPGESGEISEFCELNYGVSFPLFKKIEVNGDKAHPLFVQLKSEAPGLLGSKRIKWNFTKFLVNGQGKVVKRYAPTTKPEDLRADIDALLA